MSTNPAWPVADVINGTRVVLMPLRPADAMDVARALADPALHDYTGGEPASEQQLRRRFTFLAVGHSPDGSEGWLNWIVRDRSTDTVVGTAQATMHQRSEGLVADVAWIVGTPWQGQGVAKESAGVLVSWLWSQDVAEIVAYIHPEHAASAGVARSVGMHATDTVVDGEIRWRVAKP